MPKCPECGSDKTWKDGLRYIQDTPVQRFLCRNCSYRFSKTSSNVSKDPECNQRVQRMALNMPTNLLGNRQICVTATRAAKNLVAEQEEKILQESKDSTKSDLINFVLYMKKLGRRETTIRTYSNYVKSLSKHADLKDPEAIKLVIATKFTDTNTKRTVTNSYDLYLKFKDGTWEKPDYKREHKQVFIPTDEELKIAINYGNKATVAFCKLIYETGARVNEAERLEWTDVDRERNIITIKASKNGKSRLIPVTKELIELICCLKKTSELVFPKRGRTTRQANFWCRMKRLSETHNNPRFRKIHFHTFRHCKALREYHSSNNMQRVKRILGPKSILTTQNYVELYEDLYANQERETMTEIALNIQEAKKLKDRGFQYECGHFNDGGMLFWRYK
jgi:integrase